MTSLFNGGFQLWNQRRQRKVIYVLPAGASPTGQELVLRRWHAGTGVLTAGTAGGISLVVQDPVRKDPRTDGWGRPKPPRQTVELDDGQARAFLQRAMVHLNRSGASRRRLEGAVGLLSGAGSAEKFLLRTATAGRSLGKRKDLPGRHLLPEGSLALEMALHEEQERRAMQGELALLEAAWRDAEQIAAIADSLAVEAPAR